MRTEPLSIALGLGLVTSSLRKGVQSPAAKVVGVAVGGGIAVAHTRVLVAGDNKYYF